MDQTSTETAAMFMIGDGLLATVEPRRHCMLWKMGPAVCQDLMESFIELPGMTRVNGGAGLGAGAGRRPRVPPIRPDGHDQQFVGSTRTGHTRGSDGLNQGERMSAPSTIDLAALGTCPVPKSRYDQILLGHGSGGGLTAELIRDVFVPGFDNPILAALEDQATVRFDGKQNGAKGQRIAFTTDSFVIRPLFFPGGDIGRLAVHGTVNDLAVGGAIPMFLSAAFILEEGLPIANLKRIVASMRQACAEARVTLVTGDTKVVDRGKEIRFSSAHPESDWSSTIVIFQSAMPGQATKFSSPALSATTALPSCRFAKESNSKPFWKATALRSTISRDTRSGPRNPVHARPHPRRGLQHAQRIGGCPRIGVRLTESAFPIRPEVKAACEMLGLDPLYVANEGKLIAVVPPDQSDARLAAMRKHPLGKRRVHRSGCPGARGNGCHEIIGGRRACGHDACRRTIAKNLLNAKHVWPTARGGETGERKENRPWQNQTDPPGSRENPIWQQNLARACRQRSPHPLEPRRARLRRRHRLHHRGHPAQHRRRASAIPGLPKVHLLQSRARNQPGGR